MNFKHINTYSHSGNGNSNSMVRTTTTTTSSSSSPYLHHHFKQSAGQNFNIFNQLNLYAIGFRRRLLLLLAMYMYSRYEWWWWYTYNNVCSIYLLYIFIEKIKKNKTEWGKSILVTKIMSKRPGSLI